jgi:RNA exonuclease 1
MVSFHYTLPLAILLALIMASGLGMLKHLPCPAGKKCTAFQCLFKHDSDVDLHESNKEPDQSSSSKDPLPLKDEGGPRKRVKLTSESLHNQEASRQQSQSQPSKPQSAADSGSLHAKPTSNASAIQATPNSPQPASKATQLRRSSQPTSRGEVITTPTQKPAGPASSGKSATNLSSSTKTPSKVVPKKVETLNPRHLTKSPAKYDIRWKLVKHLHEQYARLNAELKKVVKEDEALLIMSDQELIVRTLDEEENIAVKKSAIYGNVVKNRIMNYKRMTVQLWKEERAEMVRKAKGDVIDPNEANKRVETGLNPQQEIDFLHRLSSDLKGYERFGYVSTVPKDEDMENAKQAVEASGNIEVCDRCTRRFTVFPGRREEDGALTSGQKLLCR